AAAAPAATGRAARAPGRTAPPGAAAGSTAARAARRCAAAAPTAGGSSRASGAPATARPAAAAGATHTKVCVERDAVERNDDDLGAMVGAGRNRVVLVHIGHGPGDVHGVAAFQHHARPLHLVPGYAGAVSLVTEDLLVVARRPGVPVILPTGDAVGRVDVPADAISRARVDDVVHTAAAPNVGILFIGVIWIGYARC